MPKIDLPVFTVKHSSLFDSVITKHSIPATVSDDFIIELFSIYNGFSFPVCFQHPKFIQYSLIEAIERAIPNDTISNNFPPDLVNVILSTKNYFINNPDLLAALERYSNPTIVEIKTPNHIKEAISYIGSCLALDKSLDSLLITNYSQYLFSVYLYIKLVLVANDIDSPLLTKETLVEQIMALCLMVLITDKITTDVWITDPKHEIIQTINYSIEQLKLPNTPTIMAKHNIEEMIRKNNWEKFNIERYGLHLKWTPKQRAIEYVDNIIQYCKINDHIQDVSNKANGHAFFQKMEEHIRQKSNNYNYDVIYDNDFLLTLENTFKIQDWLKHNTLDNLVPKQYKEVRYG